MQKIIRLWWKKSNMTQTDEEMYHVLWKNQYCENDCITQNNLQIQCSRVQLDIIDIYRTFHPKTINFTFFSSAHGTFSRIDHILGHKSSLGKFKKIEIIPVIFSGHNAVRLDLNYRKKKKLLKIQTYGG